MLLLRRLGRKRALSSLLPLRRHASSPLSSSTATAPCSSWSPSWPPSHDAPPRPPTTAAAADDDDDNKGISISRRGPSTFSYDLSRARTMDVVSPFVHPGQEAGPPVRVVVVSNPIDARHWSEELAQALAAEADGGSSSTSYGDGEAGALGVVGLDLEWKPTFAAGAPERRASVLQLSGPGLCLVIQLMRLNGQLPRALKQILKDPTLLKVGVSINSDLSKLRRDWGLASQGSHDVGLAGGRILHKETFRMCSVSSMVQAMWGAGLGKDKSVRLSNWETHRLTDSQVRYAALDAIAGREIYLELRRRGELPADEGLEGMMTKWLLSGDEGDWRRARSLAVERDSLRRLYTLGTGQSCFQRGPPIVKEGAVAGPGGPLALAAVAAEAEAEADGNGAGVMGLDEEEEEEEEEQEEEQQLASRIQAGYPMTDELGRGPVDGETSRDGMSAPALETILRTLASATGPVGVGKGKKGLPPPPRRRPGRA